MMVHRRGEVVWARVAYPQKWWPGLIHRADGLGVGVSFFNLHKPLHLLESEVCSFDDNFGLLAKSVKCSTGMALLDRAVDLLGRRAVWSLACLCLYPLVFSVKGREVKREGRLFDRNRVLGFVLALAVSPIVDDSEFVVAVTVVNQLRVFRRFLVAQQMLLFSGDCSKLNSCLPFSTITGSVDQQLENAVQEVEDLQEDLLKNGPWTEIDLSKHQSVREMLLSLRSLALDSDFVQGEHLNTLKMHILKFRQFSSENASQQFHIFSQDSTNSQIYDPRKNQPRSQFHGKACQDGLAPPLVIYAGNRLKRQQYEPTEFCFPPKLRKTMPLFSTNKGYTCFQESKSGCKIPIISGSPLLDIPLDFCITVPCALSDIFDSYLQRNKNTIETNLFDALSSESCFKVDIQNQHLTRAQWLEIGAGNNLWQLVTNGFIYGLVNCTSLGCHTMHSPILKEDEVNVDVLNNSRTLTCLVQIQNSSVVLDSGTTYATKGIQLTDVRESCKLMLLQHSATETVLNCGIKAHSDENLTPDQLRREHTGRDDASHSEACKGMGMNSSCRDSFTDCKELQLSGIDQSFKPPKARRPLDVFAKCKTLHMKFLEGFIIPSKNDIIKTFSRFGTVDLLRTKIFSRMSSAQVVFLHELDAVVAYQYMKRKKTVFQASKVLFWLDRHEHERGGTRSSSSAAKPGGCNLRSCLKKSSHHRKEDRKCKQRVRFIMET